MTANDDGNRRTLGLALLCAALLVSALTVLAVRGDVLTGRAPAVVQAPAPCAVPELAADESPVNPGNRPAVVFGVLPMLPLPGLGPVKVAGFNWYASPEEYAHFSPSLLGGSTKAAMQEHGFVRADAIGYEAGTTFFGAEAFQTGSPAQAAALERDLLANACRAGVAAALRPLPDIPGGVAFVYHDSDAPPYRAFFLVGDTVLRLNVCVCTECRVDPNAVLDSWARQVDARMRVPQA